MQEAPRTGVARDLARGIVRNIVRDIVRERSQTLATLSA